MTTLTEEFSAENYRKTMAVGLDSTFMAIKYA